MCKRISINWEQLLTPDYVRLLTGILCFCCKKPPLLLILSRSIVGMSFLYKFFCLLAKFCATTNSRLSQTHPKKWVRWLQPKFSQDDVLKRTRNGKENLVSDLISFRWKPNHVSEVLQAWRVFNKDQVQTAVCQMGTGWETFRTLGACAGDVRSDHTDEASFDGMPTWKDINDEFFFWAVQH